MDVRREGKRKDEKKVNYIKEGRKRSRIIDEGKNIFVYKHAMNHNRLNSRKKGSVIV